jgi:hypothetical protein
MKATMAAYLDCSTCKSVTLISTIPPRCAVCGSSHGMVVSRAGELDPQSTSAPLAAAGKK